MAKLKNITLKAIREWFDDNGFEPRHDIHGLKHASNKKAKEYGVNGMEIFTLIVANEPIPELYTHSYGFHTHVGREIINSFQGVYYTYLRRTKNK